MSNSEVDTRELEARQWMYDHLVDRQGRDVLLPPPPLVETLAELGLEPFDLGWAAHGYDPNSEVTTWDGLVATPTVLVEFESSATLVADKKWSGNLVEKRVEYAKKPAIDLNLLRFDQVVSARAKSTGASNSSDGDRPRTVWLFCFKDGTKREYELSSDESEPADLRSLCRRILSHL